jgi:hypothetical protein
LASVARQHEDRIEELQHKLDETKADLAAKKREIQDHKSKEKTNLHQISAVYIIFFLLILFDLNIRS